MTLHLSHIARYAPSIQSHIHLKTFAQILTIVFKQPLKHTFIYAIAECGPLMESHSVFVAFQTADSIKSIIFAI